MPIPRRMVDGIRTVQERADPACIFPPLPDVLGDGSGAVISLDRTRRLVAGAKLGDRAAFGELYRSLHGPVTRFVGFRMAGDGVEDAVAETFVRAWASLSRHQDNGAPFVAWLYGIARHVVLDELAKRRHTEPRAELPDRVGEWRHDDMIDLADAIERLPEEQRTIVELKFFLGLRNDEVGRALGKSPGAVNTQQWRALVALRELLIER